MNIVVQKFGGTSLANNENRIKVVEKIIKQCNKGRNVVVVVSAIGRKGDPYSTDSLLSLVKEENVNKRELDLLMSCGEIISSTVIAGILHEKNISCQVLTGYQAGIITDESFGYAKILSVNPNNILKALSKNKVVIVAGFQGGSEQGEVTTLGRGGSDISAVIIGEALDCNYVEIYTDVDGVMTADPVIVPDAKVIKNITYTELFQLAEDGAKVIHPKAVEIAERSNIKIIIKNTFSDNVGTIVSNIDIYKSTSYIKKNVLINSITYKKDRIQIIIDNNNNSTAFYSALKEISNKMINIDLINFTLDRKIFTINDKNYYIVKSILDNYNLSYRFIRNCNKISLVGNRIKGTPGVMYRIINSLYKEKIEILQSSDSHTTIWCLVKAKDANKALRCLHKEFNLCER